jgi:hypothetical protein
MSPFAVVVIFAAVFAVCLTGLFAVVAVDHFNDQHATGLNSPADVQAIDQADDESVALTVDHRWLELEAGFAADALAYRGGLGMPGEHRTTFTREDYQS